MRNCIVCGKLQDHMQCDECFKRALWKYVENPPWGKPKMPPTRTICSICSTMIRQPRCPGPYITELSKCSRCLQAEFNLTKKLQEAPASEAKPSPVRKCAVGCADNFMQVETRAGRVFVCLYCGGSWLEKR